MGLRTENAVAVLGSVGASNKDYRRNAGFRGIGRLAGIVFCNRLTFTTKAEGQSQKTVVAFNAEELRKRLAPEGKYAVDAAETLASCVEASLEDAADVDAHFFEVRLTGFRNPPKECEDFAMLKSFLSQVSPVPYDPKFPLRNDIIDKAQGANFAIEWVRVFVRDGEQPFAELFKPYGAEFSVKRDRVRLTGFDEVFSPQGKWWGWIGRKRTSGAFGDPDARGIRVRVRNIQIDDTTIIRDIFATSSRGGKPRSSYARFADWYVGEIFLHPEAAIPNARRDGFEENEAWQQIRDELDGTVAERYGRLAYRTSKADQLSIDSLNRRFAEFSRNAEPLIGQSQADWDRVSQAVAEANELQRRIGLAVRTADDSELAPLRALVDSVSGVKRSLDALVLATPPAVECSEEIATALSDLTQRLYRALKLKLGPSEWQQAREIVRKVSGEDVR